MIRSRLRTLLEVARGFERLPAQNASAWLRLGLPVVLMAVALVVTDVLRTVLPGGGIFLVLLLPVMAMAVLFGVLPGFLALALGAAGAWLLVPTTGHPWLSDPMHLLRLGLYLVIGGSVVLLAFAMRRAVMPIGTGPRAAPLAGPRELLTARELEVLTLAAAGLSTEAIGKRLFLSRHTIKTHFGNAYSKLGVRNRAEAVAAALQAGWIGREGRRDSR